MKAALIREFGGPETLQIADLPRPEPGPGEVLVKIAAAGVNPVDWKIREGYLDGRIPHKFPVVLGWDLAGEVVELGVGITTLQKGDQVWSYCRQEIVQNGTYTEYIALPEQLVAPRPKNLSAIEAATVPLAALTAYQSLFEAGDLQEGQTVLIQAAAGGVGCFAVQLAKLAKARVIGTASRHNHAYLRELGADHVIGYSDLEVPIAVDKLTEGAGVDLAFDCVGGEVTGESAQTLHDHGRLVTITNFAAVDELKEKGIDAMSVFVRPDPHQLQTLREHIEAGELRTEIEKVYSLDQAAEALERSASGHVRGKLALEIG